jgi:glycosyltransferase 2 family protein
MPPEVIEKKKDSKLNRKLKFLLKLAITVLCFWYISTRIDFTETFNAAFDANWLLLILALFLFVVSKLFSSFRLNVNFRNIGLQLSERKNIRLYWLGMFYNLFLPGAISGDAYKVILLNRRYKTSYKKGTAAVLLDRFSGVLALAILLSIYGIAILKHPYYDTILAAGTLLAFIGYYFIIRFVFRYFLPGFVQTLILGLGVQILQVICIYLIMMSIGISVEEHEWIFIFLASAVITVLPVSLGGGLGTRELVFAEGARFFHLEPQTGVVISLLFYLVTVAGSLWGLYYNFNDPLEESSKNG